MVMVGDMQNMYRSGVGTEEVGGWIRQPRVRGVWESSLHVADLHSLEHRYGGVPEEKKCCALCERRET